MLGGRRRAAGGAGRAAGGRLPVDRVGGDNALALLTCDPARVVALDLSPAQLACMELRVSAYRNLLHEELLELIGSRPSERRAALYARCRDGLSPAARRFWEARPAQIAA